MTKQKKYIFRPGNGTFQKLSVCGEILHRIALGVEDGDSLTRDDIRSFTVSADYVFNKFRQTGILQ